MKSIGRVVLAAVAATNLVGVAYGQADFEGIWLPSNQGGGQGGGGGGQSGGQSGGRGGGGGPGLDDVKLTPAGQAEFDTFRTENDPAFRCIMPGIPKGFTDPYPMEIIQQDHQIVFLYEYFHQVRRVFLDGREVPDYWPASLSGYSTGHWEGDTLVVRTTRLSPNQLSPLGLPFSGAEDAYVVERYTRSGDELTFTAEIHDPTYYEEMIARNRRWSFAPDGEIWEYDCNPEFGDVG